MTRKSLGDVGHECDLLVVTLRFNVLLANVLFPKFFAIRDIDEGEELTPDIRATVKACRS